ncbi:MAG: MotA/TolQ/ExbB proton channel family protein [Clostridia bacterium]|nr:MotA/TolQ/ExbB proton channel family protein [Clostridia bacterium]
MMPEILTDFSKTLPNLTDWLIYGAIAVVTLIGVIKCLLPLWRTTSALRSAIRKLQASAGEILERPVWQESRFMGKRLRGSWLRFLQNAEQLDHRGLPCNVEDYINDDTVTHGPGNAQLAELIPSLLTSLGILGTFIGMTQGLRNLDVTSTDAMMTGIQQLLSGMTFAFGTSVAGVSCSLVFNMLNRIAQGSSYRAIDDFVESFTQLAMRRPLDNDVQLICQNQDRNQLLGTVTQTVSTQMASSIEHAIGRAMAPVAQSMDHFLVGATRGQVEGVHRIVNSFIQEMNSSLNNEFLLLGQTLSSISQHEAMTMEQLNKSMGAASAIGQDAAQLHGVSQEIMNRFEQYVRELADARTRDGSFEKTSADLLNAMRQANENSTRLLGDMQQAQKKLNDSVSSFASSGGTALRGAADAVRDSSSHLTEVSQTMREAGDTLSGSYQSFVQNVVEGLSRSLGMFEENMSGMLSAFSEKLDQLNAAGTNGATAAQLSGLQEAMADMREAIETATARLRTVEG